MGTYPRTAVHTTMLFNEPEVACTAITGRILKKEYEEVKRR